MAIYDYRDCLESSVLSQSADAYIGYLQHHQYCPRSIRVYLHSIEHFARWLTRRHILLRSVDESIAHRFVTEHLPVCRCPEP
jgi:integrase/recombinase XerD